MYIPDNEWDDLNSFCCDLVEQLEAMPDEIFFACKKEAIALCYSILNMQDKPKRDEKSLEKIKNYPYEAYQEFWNKFECIRLGALMKAFHDFTFQKDIADWHEPKEKIKFEIELKKYLSSSIRLSKQILRQN